MTDTLQRAVIIGTGAIAHAHAHAIQAYVDADGAPAARIVAVVDTSAERATAFAEQWGVAATFDSLEAALAAGGLDIAHICTPPGVHADQTILALEAGLDVVVEKPPALSLEQLDAMTDAAERTGRTLAVVFQQRTGTAAAHVRGLLDSGELGRPLVANCQTLWYRDPAYFEVPWRGKWATEGGGPTLGHGIHQIDLLAYLLGAWSSVQGQLWRLARDVETEDVSTAVVTFESGAVASVVTSLLSPRETSSIRIDTELATITVDHLYGHGHEHWSITPAPGVDVPDSWALPAVEEPSGHDPLVRDIYDALRSGAPLPSTAADPSRSFEIVAAVYASAASGSVVTPATLRLDPSRRGSLEAPVQVLAPSADG
ncbi:Gfo/Idh/MocA family oxidoreductase [Agromyces atrinae]|uniref:Gfo/Idh/MocA family protein n=1 Tax=Agromyces atrinae TaxID=592376 RepID=UPI001F5A2FDA|nr:Gfo/Idh/MocA family oxidoreductase [Agromyces atrinae]MCI2957649.1 Gfo/Idh/MocA family oxidoreductase [Agromyces atrinae]